MSWIDITQTIMAVLLAIVPGIAYPYLRDYANQKKRELQRFRKRKCFMKTLYCPSCGEVRSIEVKNEKETYPVKGEFVEIDALVSYCTHCGEQILDIDLDDRNLETAFRQYQKNHKGGKE